MGVLGLVLVLCYVEGLLGVSGGGGNLRVILVRVCGPFFLKPTPIKMGPFNYDEKLGQSYAFLRKSGLIVYLAALKKWAIRAAHPYYVLSSLAK